MTIPQIDDRIAVVDLADDLEVRKQRIFKILPRLGIVPTQRRELGRGNQQVATISSLEAATIRVAILGAGEGTGEGTVYPSAGGADDAGFFYLIQLEPEHDPGRFKVGFTSDLDGRLQKHRCSAPFAKYVGTWPCRRTWERAAIDCSTDGCERLHTEVFRANSPDLPTSRAQRFFSMMPALSFDPLVDESQMQEPLPDG